MINTGGTLRWRPSTRTQLTLEPTYTHRVNASQFATTRVIPQAGITRFVLADIEQHTVALGTRVNHTFTPSLTVELHARPFISSGHYPQFYWVVPGREHFRERGTRIGAYASDQVVIDRSGSQPIVRVDDSGDGNTDIQFAHPDFARSALQANGVIRWEFRPGSTLFFVWSHDRSDLMREGRWDFRQRVDNLLAGDGRNVIAIKATYLLSL